MILREVERSSTFEKGERTHFGNELFGAQCRTSNLIGLFKTITSCTPYPSHYQIQLKDIAGNLIILIFHIDRYFLLQHSITQIAQRSECKIQCQNNGSIKLTRVVYYVSSAYTNQFLNFNQFFDTQSNQIKSITSFFTIHPVCGSHQHIHITSYYFIE